MICDTLRERCRRLTKELSMELSGTQRILLALRTGIYRYVMMQQQTPLSRESS